jgi:formylglycine-generating enzyme required for sulfatase activity
MSFRLIIAFIIAILITAGDNQQTANAETTELLVKSAPESEVQNTKNFTEATTGIQFVAIDGNCFSMGDTFGDGEKDEKPVHKTCVSDFAISKHDVTVGQFRRFVDSTNHRTEAEKGGGCFVLTGNDWKKQDSNNWKNPGFKQNDQHPVTCVNWNDAQAFVIWMNTLGSRRYRLSTEAEWEYVARSGGKKERFAGFSDRKLLFKYANFCDNNCVTSWKTAGQNDGYNGTSPVGNYQPNALGLYDMTGNLWQWVGDWYGERYYGNSPKDNPKGAPSGTERVIRGGSWLSIPDDLRAAERNSCSPDYNAFDIGFRLVSPVK